MRKKETSSGLGIFLIVLILVVVIITQFENKTEKKIEKSKPIQKEEIKKVERPSINWDKIAQNLISDYQGKIVSIDQLNSSTCWVQMSYDLSDYQAITLAENVGYYIKNSTRTSDFKGETPSVHVFKDRKHIAIARSSYDGAYNGKLDIKNW